MNTIRIKLGLFILLHGLFTTYLKADEGMFPVSSLQPAHINEMQKLGFQLNSDSIYSEQNPSLKDAIVIFGNGCTGELVSREGLIFTNHHCGFEAIQSLSSVEHDYLKDGFWSKSKSDELPVNGLTISLLKKFENITDSIIPYLTDSLSENARNEIISKISKRIESRESDSGRYEAEVREFYYGNEFYLIVYETYRDVRLVGAPPSSIGKFGGDTDNWMWPRHTGDFSIFRVYANTEGKPADFNKENIPLKPKKYLKINGKGINKNDFAMIMGYPGNTSRYITSREVSMIENIGNTSRIKIREIKQDIWKKEMNANPKVKIQYASKYAISSNYYKYSIGQNQGFERLKTIENKEKQEKLFLEWASKDTARNKKYGKCIENIKMYLEKEKQLKYFYEYYIEIIRGIEILSSARELSILLELANNPQQSSNVVNAKVEELKEYFSVFFKDYDKNTDQKVMAALLSLYSKDLSAGYKTRNFIEIEKKYKGNFEKFSAKLFKESILADSSKLFETLNNRDLKKIAKDPAIRFLMPLRHDAGLRFDTLKKYSSVVLANQRIYMDGLKQMNSNPLFYPDANFSMRVTYGKVCDYYPADAVYYNYITTLKGVMEKESKTNDEFEVAAKLKELYYSKDFRPYSQNDTMPVCFITDNDITGGNSGSPVLDKNGKLIGLAFDGNWEAMTGDITFDKELKRTINVDIRYVLFIIDKFASAQNIIKELEIE